jgi:hypothetical protein
MDILPKVEMDDNETQNIEGIIEDVDEEVENPTEEEEIEEPIEVIEKEKLDTNDIFEKKPVVVPVKKEKKSRKPMTEEHKQKLAKAREKALATRKANAEKRKKGELKKPSEIKQEKILKEKELQRPTQIINNTTNITKDDIHEIVEKSTKNTLEQYEKVRKERKAKKKEDNKKALEQQKVHHVINSALGKKYGQDGFFSDCF